jgi:hypothetical protein
LCFDQVFVGRAHGSRHGAEQGAADLVANFRSRKDRVQARERVFYLVLEGFQFVPLQGPQFVSDGEEFAEEG